MLPDSPRWCMAHGMKEEGTRILAWLEDKDSVDHPEVVLKRKEIEVSLAQESAGGTLSRHILSRRVPVLIILTKCNWQVHSDIAN